ncbi:asparagine synthase (glutamine-hydrolyzing) [Candidatus Sumerlaeota bacterium]|nr:asparagine synthase (glutamine-hydrolyzing) [Candidatus Sumerlaeota bacterium]
MCGICGWAAVDSESSFDADLLKKMTRALAHRGPDGEGFFQEPGVALGHRRLSILDIEKGAQPFFSPSKRYVLTYNGEIYNAPELRADLLSRGYPFHTHCDTEVIAVLADHRDFDFVNDLEGIFAFALWDRKEKRLLLARDGMGVKPLVFRIEKIGIYFASEAKALYTIPGLKWTIDPQALHHYLGMNYIPAPYTIYEESQKLGKGEILEWRQGSQKRSIFWSPPDSKISSPCSRKEIGEKVRALVEESAKGQLQSDVPLGIFLSSGMDSAVVLESSRKFAESKPVAYCVGFHESSFDERPGARETAHIMGAHLVEFILEPKVKDLIPQMAAHFDEPFADSSAVPVWELCRQSAQHIKVALSGEGGDEVFCGYEPYHAHLYAMQIERLKLDIFKKPLCKLLDLFPASDEKATKIYKLKRFLPHLGIPVAQRHFLFKAISDESRKQSLYTKDWRKLHKNLVPTVSLWEEAFRKFGKHDPISAAALSDMNIYLPYDILVKVDISSMAHSLEVRVPLLDRRIVEYVSALPDSEKIDLFRKKKPLRAAFENDRTRSIFRRPKQGFSIPASKWLKEDLKPLFMDAVNSEAFRDFQAIDVNEVLHLYQMHEEKKEDLSRTLWGLLMLALWRQSRPG